MYILLSIIGAFAVGIYTYYDVYKGQVEKELNLIKFKHELKSGKMDNKLVEFIQDTERRFGELELNNEKRFNKFKNEFNNTLSSFKKDIVQTVKDEVVATIDEKLKIKEFGRYKKTKAAIVAMLIAILTFGSSVGASIIAIEYQIKKQEVKTEKSN